jgi:ATP-dependent helicase HrpB
LTALVSEGDISDNVRARFGGPNGMTAREGADLLERLERFRQAREVGFARDRMRGLGVDGRAAEAAERGRRQYAAALRRDGKVKRPASPDEVDQALAMATLAAFPDRIMRRRGPGSSEALMASGGAADVGPHPPDDLLCAVDVEERSGTGARKAVQVRLAVGISADWLLDIAPGELGERDQLVWNEQRQRVERVSALVCGAITLEESRQPAQPSDEASRMLAEAVLASGKGGDSSVAVPTELQAKLEVLRQAFPDADVPALDVDSWRGMVVAACAGLTSMAELQESGIADRWLANLPMAVARLLREEVPERVRLAGGRVVPVHYQSGQPPWIESRLQDFFGMAAGPSICRGRVPLTLHLLAPNHRAVQVTRDLANFWRQHYPAIRRELCRRYPRHPWPEDGATATPPPPHVRGGGRH